MKPQYRGHRRAVVPSARLGRHGVAILGALGLALSVGLAVQTFAAGDPTLSSAADNAHAPGRPPSRAGNPPVALPGHPSPTVAVASLTPANSAMPTRSPSSVPVPAIAPTVSPVPAPSVASISYEAEAPENTHSLGADTRPLPVASGGQLVGNIGDGRTLRFNGVVVGGGGQYTMVVFYVAGDVRTAVLRVNDEPPQMITFAATGGWDRVGSVAVTIELFVGLNTVEFGNVAGQWAPDLDRITVR
jgi:hypothetical protein